MAALIDSEGRRTSEVILDTRYKESLGIGFREGQVSRIHVGVYGVNERVRSIWLAEKVFNSPRLETTPEEAVIKTLKIHQSLKEKGLPVVPTMRMLESGGRSVFMTDLTKNGKNEVVSVLDFVQLYGLKGKFSGKEIELRLSNSDEVSKQIANLYKISIDKQVIIQSCDAPFLVIEKDANYGSIILGDLGTVHDDLKVEDGSPVENLYHLTEFIDRMNKHLRYADQISNSYLFLERLNLNARRS